MEMNIYELETLKDEPHLDLTNWTYSEMKDYMDWLVGREMVAHSRGPEL